MKKLNWIKNEKLDFVLKKDCIFWENLSKKAYPLSKGTVRMPISMEPFIIEKKEYLKINKQLKLVINAGVKIVENYFGDEKIRQNINLNNLEKELLLASKDEDLVGVVRADIFYDKTPKIVELNTDFPDGFFMHDITTNNILNLLEDKNKYLVENHSLLFEKLLQEKNIEKNEHIFIAYKEGTFFLDEFELSRLKLNKLGFSNISIGPIEKLVIKNDKHLYYEGKKVKVIRRCVELSKIRDNNYLINAFTKAIKNKNIIIVNNFKMRLLGHKSLLTILSNSDFYDYFTKEEIIAIENLLPKTRLLSKMNKRKIIDNKNNWVLKPSDLAEGENIYIGSNIKQKEWEKIIEKHFINGEKWIIQEKISIPETNFNIIENNKINTGIKKYDFNPHLVLYKNTVKEGNILVRFSDSEILNIMKGGGITYALIEK